LFIDYVTTAIDKVLQLLCIWIYWHNTDSNRKTANIQNNISPTENQKPW